MSGPNATLSVVTNAYDLHRIHLSQATGNHVESFTSKHLQDDVSLPAEEKDDIIKYCSAALYIGGADTVRRC